MIPNLQATKLHFATSATKGGGLRFSVWFKILYSVIQRLIRHCLLSKMVYLNIKLLRYSTGTAVGPSLYVLDKIINKYITANYCIV